MVCLHNTVWGALHTGTVQRLLILRPEYKCNCLISSEPVFYALLLPLFIFLFIWFIWFLYFNLTIEQEESSFPHSYASSLVKRIKQVSFNPKSRKLYCWQWRRICTGSRNIRSTLPREAATQAKPPQSTKDIWTQSAPTARPQNPCLCNSSYTLWTGGRQVAVAHGKEGCIPTCVWLTKKQHIPFYRQVMLPSHFLPPLQF